MKEKVAQQRINQPQHSSFVYNSSFFGRRPIINHLRFTLSFVFDEQVRALDEVHIIVGDQPKVEREATPLSKTLSTEG